MSLHEQSVGKSDEWYTPAYVFEAMGVRFDMDPCPGPSFCPAGEWCAVGLAGDGLAQAWAGFVWLNPPFGGRNGIVPWLDKFVQHSNGVVLVPDRTSAPWWQKYAGQANAVLFVSPKIRFIGADGQPGKSPAQGTALLAGGSRGIAALERAADAGLGILFGPWERPF